MQSTAKALRNDQVLDIPLEEVVIGDLVISKPDEKIPVDGIITEGYSSKDESMITGESIRFATDGSAILMDGIKLYTNHKKMENTYESLNGQGTNSKI